MSIEYFVEGKATLQTGGDNRTFAKEGISHNSAATVEQKGSETGVNYNTAQTVNPNDKPVNTIDVDLNLFFDGTMNNKSNTEAGTSSSSSSGSDSYANDFTNIARGYDAVDSSVGKQVAVYIEGIGTVDGARDTMKWFSDYPNNIGGALGQGDRGVEAKVTKGCLTGTESLAKKFKGKEIDVLRINVYGFSRGATAARHFVHVATSTKRAVLLEDSGKYIVYAAKWFEQSAEDEKNKKNNQQNVEVSSEDRNHTYLQSYGFFGACLLKNKIKVKRVVFNFIGLYDTVASFGMNHRGFKVGSFSVIDNDSEELGLNAVRQANFTLQIASDNEYRENFSLTNINSTGIKGLEFTLPGVHSDIGGSYKDGAEEKANICNGTMDECKKMKEILESEGWFAPGQLEIFEIEKSLLGINYSTKYELRGTRKLSNHYDKIPLKQMFYYSKQFEVKYVESLVKDNDIINSDIQNAYSQLLSYMNQCNDLRNRYVEQYNKGGNASIAKYQSEIKALSYLSIIDQEMLKKLRNGFFHWSANVDATGMGPRISGALTVDKRKRSIIPG
ncbi:hypothetical protein GCM10023210_35070 [Chryseobacterium ginsengisoli]|uniref:T6SS Phospholipase effector Tle1-like catalytic domain-containing protein n=1 Tax=Chryseobacterium ginsengisoli TaxID=363853 RepID=A0ABP9MQ22_9FLAO